MSGRRSVEIEAGGVRLPGDLSLPNDAVAVVVFAHGSGSSRLSPRNIQVARRLHLDGLATLLFDLLTEDESTDRRKVFDISLLGGRLTTAVRWVRRTVPDLPIGLFGASTGAAAALVAAAAPSSDEPSNDVAAGPADGGSRLTEAEERVARLAAVGLTNQEIAEALSISLGAVESLMSSVYAKLGSRSEAGTEPTSPHEPIEVRAIVSRGGRPDLAGEALRRVASPTLLIVGERDPEVLELNREAQARMPCETRLEIVPGATHLFEEAGALERVADLATGWFTTHRQDPGSGP